ncbi:MAG: FAD-binding oxidoreductase, partial [Paracoccus sp. (in: a-proteobacteria)]
MTRGRANTLRLAISGQLGPDALTSDAMADTLALCVSCKGCKRECPTGVDMARMKIEVLAARARSNGLTLHDRLVAYLPRYAPVAARLHWLMNLRNRLPLLARLMQRPTGFSAARALPHWSARPFRDAEAQGADADIVLFADPFNRWFEPENLRAAVRVLNAAGRRVTVARPLDGGPPLQCGRTLLSAGLVDEARTEARRLIDALLPHIRAGRSIVGLEPSSLLTLRDEIPAMLPGDDTAQIADAALMFEEYVAAEHEAGRWSLPLRPPGVPVLLHGHCHQKALDVMPAIHKALALLPETDIQLIETSCCGMAGSFGYGLETEAISRQMGELSLFPAIRAAPGDAIIVADGTS